MNGSVSKSKPEVVWEKLGHPYVMTKWSVAFDYVINRSLVPRELTCSHLFTVGTRLYVHRLDRHSIHSIDVHSRGTRPNGDADRYIIRASRREQVWIRSKS